MPLSRLADCISETKAELEKVDLPAPVLAHAGDGNFHVCIFVDPNDPQQVAEAKRLSRNITMRALAMDGTSEHARHVHCTLCYYGCGSILSDSVS